MHKNRQAASSISGGIFLIGLGLLFFTSWWWPGIMLVIGASSAAELFFRGKPLEAAGTFLFFLAIPIGIALVTNIHIRWEVIVAVALIGIGGMMLGKAVFLKD